MNKLITLFFLNSFTALLGSDNIFIDAKIAIQLIEKNDIQFISVEKSSKLIRSSKIVNINDLSSTTVLGDMPCKPLYACPSQVKKYFSNLGIVRDQALILYDNSYGVYASALYSVLESMGHKNVTILNGGSQAVALLDPNQKLYNKYNNELIALKKLKNDENSTSSKEDRASKSSSLLKKIEMLSPHLLIEKNIDFKIEQKSDYVISEKKTSYLLSKEELQKIVMKIRHSETNETIIDACPMIDIVGDKYGSYMVGVTPLSWKKLINKKENSLKEKKVLEEIFLKAGLEKDKEQYLYCMSESSKAIFMMLVMREIGYEKVKAFTGDWNVWRGDE